MAKFAVPARPTRNVINIEYFKGVDRYNASANVTDHRSPEAPNMLRDQVGKVRKRMGYATVDVYQNEQGEVARINGVHFLRTAEETLRVVHAGTSLYTAGTGGERVVLAEGLADRRSRAIQMEGKLYLADGEAFRVFDGVSVKSASEGAYIPTAYIGRAPEGGGTFYEPYNLLTAGWTDAFLGKESIRIYQLSDSGLDATPVTAQVLNAAGEWTSKAEGVDFTVNRATGQVTFTTAPGLSPVTGVDNVKITAYKTRDGYADRVNKCDVMVLYGVGGAPDRLFMAGNPDHPNLDFYSGYRDATYFGDTFYSVVGQDDGAIMGYTVLSDKLAAHRSGGQDGRNVVLRDGRLDADGEAVFPIVNMLRGEGVVSKYAFASLGREPLFLTQSGVFAITAEELTGEQYSQLRSLYLGDELTGGMGEAVALVWRDFYLLAARGKVYLLDGMQKEYQRDAPHSTYQYECYYWTGIDARVLWEQDGALWFGTQDGRLCRFHDNVDNPESYNDDGRAINAYWDTPDIDGRYFFKNKTFRYVSVRLAAAVVTGVEIFAQVRGLWSKIFDAGERARYLDWSYIDFAKFVFSADRTPRTLGGKIKLKKVDKARFRLQNNKLNEPFGLYCFALEFSEPGGNYKG